MSSISLNELVKKSFEDGTIQISHLEELLREILAKFDVPEASNTEHLSTTQSEDDSDKELNFTIDNLDAVSSKTVKTIHFNSGDEEPSHEISDDQSNSSFIDYFCNHYNSQSFETLGIKRASQLQELPAMKALPPCSFKEENIDTHLLHRLESHIRKHSDAVNLIISQNQFYQQQQIGDNEERCQKQICKIHEQVCDIHEKIKDLFFACEQNDEKIHETMINVGDFDAKIFCLKSDVKTLVKESLENKKRFARIEDDCRLKAYTSDVDEKLELGRKIMMDEIARYTRLEDFHVECDRNAFKYALMNEHLADFEKTVRRAVLRLKVQLDEKLNKDELEKLKVTTTMLFDNFVSEIKALFIKTFESAPAAGAAKNLTCISCDSKVCELKDFKTLDKAKSKVHFVINKIPVPRRNMSRIKYFCRNNSSKPRNLETVSEFTCHTKQSLLSFPNTRQCFIISKDNAIFKADPLKCLQNPNYTKV